MSNIKAGIFLLMILAFVFVFMISRKKYAECINNADPGLYKLKSLMCAGMQMLFLFRIRLSGSYWRGLSGCISELFGPRNTITYLKLFAAQKLVLSYLVMLLGVFFSILIETDTVYFGIVLASAISVFFLFDRELARLAGKRRESIRLDFPDFVNKLALLVNAGMNVSNAWERICSDSKSSTPFYKEIKKTLVEIRSGKSEKESYEDFARRCRIHEITRFVSVILQNLKKGNSEIVPLLRLFAVECWELRKNTAKRLGEEASTKMLLPLMLMFLAILLVVATPAVLALQSI